VSNLNSAQFDAAFDIESQQRRKKKRRGLAGVYVGLGNYWHNYPWMYQTMGTGGELTTAYPHGKNPDQETAEQHGAEAMGAATNGVVDTAMPAPTSDGGGMGGTLSGASGTPA
jgi:hypothetical protein